jgi:hypothetical protein
MGWIEHARGRRVRRGVGCRGFSGSHVFVDDGQAGQVGGAAGLLDDGVGVVEDLVDGHGVHLAAVVVAGLDGLLEVAAGDLGGEVVGDDLAGAALLLDPGEVGHGDPDGLAVDGEADVGGVGVAGGDGDDGALPGAVEGSPVQRSVTVKSSYMVVSLF